MMTNHQNQYDYSAKEISELLDITSKKLPQLITGIIQSIYSPEAASNIGKAVGSLYKELVDSGIPQDIALKMTKDYMISLKDMMSSLQFRADKTNK
ncbi:hypothetical protein [Thermoflavimicrobium dichotomicum]|uniref:Uncharacterized protein n=1 Tax=Thermoflavimicrobium dichotomicum TaxID=46223 RepID=A0A1I3SWC6_9BACL|nr:hypothetical protein [Thermoflavimicrobium dichotomicum]SFJ63154.1 hypothetical protein SAMN05421852_11491 [Thermoflavimicrobium dichotomicum]